MAKLFPGGSSVTRVFPASLTPGPPAASTSSWTERYSIDWTDEPGHNFSAGAYEDSFGTEWRVHQESNSDGVEIIAGSGLNLAPLTSGTSELYVPTGTPPWTAPRVFAAIQLPSRDPMYSSMSIAQPFCCQAIIDPGGTDLLANGDEFGMFLCNNAGSYLVTTVRKYDSSAFSGVGARMERFATESTSRGAIDAGSGESAVHTFFELVCFPGGTIYASSAVESDFVDPLSGTTFQKFITTNTVITSTGSSVAWENTDMYLGFFVANNGTSTAFDMFVKKTRLLTLGI